ncbi:DUF397 domain-containing protein [Lentzea sp. NPDC042327]|uniref:DUF397 domain-containing protein n=1 Tax=Lentzea sp. NPDC042327 TaxID=3154801 RepID=UPI0033D75162
MPQERNWRKSSRSTANGSGDCVEVALSQDALVRDSKNAEGEVLAFSTTAWRSLVGWIA